MEKVIRVVFVQDSLQEKVVAEQGDTIAISDRDSNAPEECDRKFNLSTTIIGASEKLETIPGCKKTPITGRLERFEFTLSKKGLIDFLLTNFDSLHFNE